MMLRVLHFPDHAPVPIHFHHGADLVWLVRDEAVWRGWGLAVVEEGPLLRQATILRGIRHLPRMNDCAVKIDQINGGGFALIEREQRKPRRGAFAIQGAQAGASALKLRLLNWCIPAFVTSEWNCARHPDHSGLRPANLATLPHFSVSSPMSRPNSAG